MVQLQVDNTNLKGVEVEGSFGRRKMYRKPEKGDPIIEVSERHAKALLGADTPGVSRYRGKVFNIAASWIPDKPLKLWRDDAEESVPQ